MVDAAAFAALWQKHQAEIQQIMNATPKDKKTPIQIDVALDDQGVAAKIDYALQFKRENYGTFMCITMSALRIMGKPAKLTVVRCVKPNPFKKSVKTQF